MYSISSEQTDNNDPPSPKTPSPICARVESLLENQLVRKRLLVYAISIISIRSNDQQRISNSWGHVPAGVRVLFLISPVYTTADFAKPNEPNLPSNKSTTTSTEAERVVRVRTGSGGSRSSTTTSTSTSASILTKVMKSRTGDAGGCIVVVLSSRLNEVHWNGGK